MELRAYVASYGAPRRLVVPAGDEGSQGTQGGQKGLDRLPLQSPLPAEEPGEVVGGHMEGELDADPG